MPLLGWLLIGSISTLFALVAGSFMSLIFYYYRGWAALVLHYLNQDLVVYHGEIAWTLGFTTGVLMSVFGKSRWKRINPRKPAKPKQESTEAKPLDSFGAVVKRTLLGTLVGLVIGLLLALVLEMMFFSASLSPIGPASWKAAVKTEYRRERRGFNEPEETVMAMTSSHPLFKYLFFIPACGMTVIGTGIGGVTGLRSWMRG